MNNTFFQFDNSYYKQSFGTPMGFPISSILADLVMQDLETNVLQNFDFNIPVYYRYVEDTIIFIQKDKIEEVLTRFKHYHDRVQFTYEIENEHNSINFLNLTIIKNEDNSIKTNWFRKNTYSGRFLNYFSNHPLQHKIGIIKNLVDSAILLPDKSFHNGNLDIIKNYLELNNYP